MKIQHFFDPPTSTLTYVVWAPDTGDALIIDPVLDYDPVSVRTHHESADRITAFVKEQALRVHWIMDTHAHADHLSGAQVLKERLKAGVAIGSEITKVQSVFRDVFDLGEGFATDGRQFDALLEDGQVLKAGSLQITVIHTPGHTPACASYLIGDCLFTGDTMFMPDFGTGRCDFPRGSAADLYDSITQKLYVLPDHIKVFVGHDYQPGGRELAFETTIGRAKQDNQQLNARTTKEEFVAFRSMRDAKLALPKLLYQSIQVNIRAGALPEPSRGGTRYLKLPLNLPD